MRKHSVMERFVKKRSIRKRSVRNDLLRRRFVTGNVSCWKRLVRKHLVRRRFLRKLFVRKRSNLNIPKYLTVYKNKPVKMSFQQWQTVISFLPNITDIKIRKI